MTYAGHTSVTASKSRVEIETTLARYGASHFCYGSEENRAIIGFRAAERVIRMSVPLPTRAEIAQGYTRVPTIPQLDAAVAQEVKRRWRALALVIKAKLEAIDSGISTIEEEFLSNIVMPDGRSLYQHVAPRIEANYSKGQRVALLEA